MPAPRMVGGRDRRHEEGFGQAGKAGEGEEEEDEGGSGRVHGVFLKIEVGRSMRQSDAIELSLIDRSIDRWIDGMERRGTPKHGAQESGGVPRHELRYYTR